MARLVDDVNCKELSASKYDFKNNPTFVGAFVGASEQTGNKGEKYNQYTFKNANGIFTINEKTSIRNEMRAMVPGQTYKIHDTQETQDTGNPLNKMKLFQIFLVL